MTCTSVCSTPSGITAFFTHASVFAVMQHL